MKKLINFLALLLVLIVAIPATMSAQESDKNVTCSGVVVDFNGDPLPGVAVFSNSGAGTITDENGAGYQAR